ncbi:TetR/AcrR family transcriptional regulator [Paraburkholderia sp. J67]|uniref:TetR/AcrR family transcriptional regulator n=1 Tax=Paraburkholderia sp. J67 TaxID=2805435 RepID=UPI002ABD71C9|nr:TetR/AcrR family transcriptional regulator [Paraburkholderia sp. J67]
MAQIPLKQGVNDAPDGETRLHTPGERARKKKLVLDAARELLAENGVSGLAVEGVASRSGVAKTTIYRRYRSKTDLALAVLLDMVDDVGAQPDVGDACSQLAAVVDRTIELLRSTLMGRIMQGLVSEVATDPELAEAYRKNVVNRRLADIRRVVERGIEKGELREGLDPEMVTDLLLGPIYYRLFLSGSPLDDGFGERLVAALHLRRDGAKAADGVGDAKASSVKAT